MATQPPSSPSSPVTKPTDLASAPSEPKSPASRARVPEHKLTVKEILDALLNAGVIDAPELDRVGGTAKVERSELHPLVVVANKQMRHARPPHTLLSLEWLTEWFAGVAGLPYLRIDPLKLDIAAVERLLPFVSYDYSARYQLLPVASDDKRVVFAVAEPYLTSWQEVLRQTLRRDIERVMANPLDINRYQMDFYSVSRSVRGATAKGALEPVSNILNFEQLVELGRRGDLSADERPIVQIVDWLFQYAFAQRASDIHLEPRREQGQIRFRIDGLMHAIHQLPSSVMNAVNSRIKILGRLDVAEKRRPQDGRIKIRTPAGREIEMRLSTMPTAFGEKSVLRIFDPDTVAKTFAQLGFPTLEESMWRTMVARPHGIVLVTGPTGSGKTTTLYTTLRHLASPDVNVCTVEDPIEMVVPEINQMQVNLGIDLGFPQGIRTLLRQDPDIIMVGEIRDFESAHMAVQAALTGHLVLSTLHTNDAASTVTRLLDLGVPHFLLQNVLIGVMAQRLVRTLCPHCKREAEISSTLWDMLVRPLSLPKPASIRAPAGCLECRNTGFLGRVGLYELLTVTPALRPSLRAEVDMGELRKKAYESGMRPLRVSAALQLAAGLTTFEEVAQVLPPLDEA